MLLSQLSIYSNTYTQHGPLMHVHIIRSVSKPVSHAMSGWANVAYPDLPGETQQCKYSVLAFCSYCRRGITQPSIFATYHDYCVRVDVMMTA